MTKKGTIVHDCWSPYWVALAARHSLCCVHLVREMNGCHRTHIGAGIVGRKTERAFSGSERMPKQSNRARLSILSD